MILPDVVSSRQQDVSKLLETINSPQDLKKLSVEQLQVLAEEIRQYILSSVSRTGGHLASNLGVVELTIALHYVFDFERDKLLWDVGHQCYTHKILTGRRKEFLRLRHPDGVSGFPNPAESEYDHFTVGHAGTAVATAIGMALGQLQRKSDEKVVALVGDASIVNGPSLEALNNLGLVKRQLLIVLNDNSMAIDPTQGAVAKYFSKIRLSHTYEDIVKTTNNILEHLPVIGKGVEEAIERLKKSIRMVLPASQMFESMNIPYFGPVDGHDIKSLVQLFTAMAHLERPAILHVYTKKGKGFNPAGDNPRMFHSTGPFSITGSAVESGSEPGGRSFTKVFGESLCELASKDERIVGITAAMCDGTGLFDFREKFPERFYDVGIAESVAVDIAAGLAAGGLRPVVCIYSTFLQRTLDQIFQEVGLSDLPVVFCVDRAGFVGADGPTHHGLMDIGFLRMIPNMVLIAPADEAEVKLALEFAIGQNRPVAIRYPKDIVPSKEFDLSACQKVFKLGKSVVVKANPDSDVAIVSYGSVLDEALRAEALLGGEGINVDVINARFAVPLDEAIIKPLAEGKGIVTVEDHSLACGFGSAVLEAAHESCPGPIEKSVKVLAAPRSFIGHDSRKNQFIQAGINADKIVQAVRQVLGIG